jgi:osmotically-inducible protein OsmY
MENSTAHLEDLVSSALERSPHRSHRTLRFETHQDRVILRGTVRSWYQKQMAQEMLRCVAGIGEIENQLEVSGS